MGVSWAPVATAATYEGKFWGAVGVGLGRFCALIAVSISSVAVTTLVAASVRCCREEAVFSVNSSAVFVMLTAALCRLSVVSWSSVRVVDSRSVVGRRSVVSASAALEVVFCMSKLSSINAIALSPSTIVFDRADVWAKCSRAMLRFVKL